MSSDMLEKEADEFANKTVNAIIDAWRLRFPELPNDWILPQYAEVYRAINLTYVAAFIKGAVSTQSIEAPALEKD